MNSFQFLSNSLCSFLIYFIEQRISENKDGSEKIKSQLDHYRHLSDSMEKIICISNLLGRVESGLEVQDYVEVVEVLQEIKKLLSSSFELEKEVEVRARRVLQVQMCVLKDRMMQEIEDAWNLLICWSLPERSATKKTESTTLLLDLSNFLCKKSLVGVLIKAMIRLDLFDCWVRKFCHLLMSNIVDNIVKNRNTLLQIMDEELRHTAKVMVYAMSSRLAVSPLEVFPKLEQIFLFLYCLLSGFNVDAAEGNRVSGESPTSLADHVWSVLGKRFFDCVCEWCLSRTFKSSNIDWMTYGQIVLAVERCSCQTGAGHSTGRNNADRLCLDGWQAHERDQRTGASEEVARFNSHGSSGDGGSFNHTSARNRFEGDQGGGIHEAMLGTIWNV